MWRLDSRTDDDARVPRDDVSSPDSVSLGNPTITPGNVAESMRNTWRDELHLIGGPSPLLHFDDGSRTRIELSSTHPGGLPQFITGQTTFLSSLIRDDVALRNAKLAAGEIADKGIELRSVRGIDAVHLAIGLAQWRHESKDFVAPVLLRPLAIRRYGHDFELKLTGTSFLNPQLARALRDQFHIELDGESFTALAITNGVFKPQPVIDHLRGITAHLPSFSVYPRLVASTFADVAVDLVDDAKNLDHPIIEALAGNPTARRDVENAHRPADVAPHDVRSPATDTLLLDADPEQEFVIAQIAAGNSVVVRTLPGTGGTQTVVNAIGSLAGHHKRVLVVSARRSSFDSIIHRLEQVGLHGLAVTPRTLRRDAVQAITRYEKAVHPEVNDVDDALVRLRKVLLDYRSALARRDPALGICVLNALERLAQLSLLPTPPSTTARLHRKSIEALVHNRHSAAEALVKAAALGEFRYGPDDSPWYGASFDTTEEAAAAHALAKRLNEVDIPRLLERANGLITKTRMRPFESIEELGVYVRLLLEMRETLDRFLPSVFDRPLTELIVATSSRRESPEMTGPNRRRLRKLAMEYVRPGVHCSDINSALRRIQQQRILWQQYVSSGAVPEVPVGLGDVHVAVQRVSEDLKALDKPLGFANSPRSLSVLPLTSLLNTVSGLAAESEVLHNLQERTALLSHLRDLELAPLLADLSKRHVSVDNVAIELELAWWQSALESMLSNDRALLSANTSVLDRLEADFRLVDEAHASANGQLLSWKQAENWKIGLVDWPEEADRLRRLLRVNRATPATLHEAAPHLSRVIAPVWLASPYEVPEIPDDIVFDAVILVDAGATTIAENLGPIRRSRQLVAFGDPVTQTPSPFDIGLRVSSEDSRAPRASDLDSLHADSALARLGELLPTLTLTRSYRAGGEDLAELMNRRFYGGLIESLPWAGTFLGHASLSFHYVEGGHGMPDRDTGAIESVDAEVARVIDLVIEHATHRQRESLMVVTASGKHAVRVRQAVLAAFARRGDLSDFILKERAEPFTVVTLEQSVAQSRDRVIFSIGYGRTPHGRILSNLGVLAEPGGERLLAVGMTRARRSMDIVSCFRPKDLDDGRMKHGISLLVQVLAESESIGDGSIVPDNSEPMLVDLATRLELRGLNVALGHREQIPLVASRGGRAVALETDSSLSGRSLRESLRLRPEVLRRLGWYYLRVHSFELFSDPDAVADRVAALVGATPVMAGEIPDKLRVPVSAG